MRKLLVAAIALVVLGGLAGPAVAGKGGNGKGNGNGTADDSTVASDIMLNATDPHFGDVVTFLTSHPDVGETVRVSLVCNQSDTVVYLWTATEAEAFTLWSANWSGGEASCVSELYYFEYRGQTQTARVTLDTTSFTVGA